jgi:hypothetical protein
MSFEIKEATSTFSAPTGPQRTSEIELASIAGTVEFLDLRDAIDVILALVWFAERCALYLQDLVNAMTGSSFPLRAAMTLGA